MSDSQNISSDLDLLAQIRIAEAVSRVTQYIADNSSSRLKWWLHPDRAAMRDEPTWNSVFFHVSNVVVPSVGETVALRCAVAVQITPARSEARTAVICAADGRVFAVAVGSDFCQAGVVAPPDSLTGETLNNFRDVEKPV